MNASDIQNRLTEERTALQAFIGLLEREQQILLSPDTEPLLDLSSEKTRAAEALTALVKKRAQYISAERGKTEAWLRSNAAGALTVWQDIQNMGQQAAQMNKTNGELIQVRMRYNQQAVQALLGASEQTAGLYDTKGKTNMPGSGRTLGSG
ncbi:MAG: flagellar protein FlgN [Sideroxydans sp.]|nr:flagellar protein FlgN [Sideroxydans sp.]